MQVIEKVKVVPEGYNGAGTDGYGRRDVNGKANAGLTLGIIGTALGAWALFGNRRSAGAIDFWFDDVDFGEDKLWKYFNELK